MIRTGMPYLSRLVCVLLTAAALHVPPMTDVYRQDRRFVALACDLRCGFYGDQYARYYDAPGYFFDAAAAKSCCNHYSTRYFYEVCY